MKRCAYTLAFLLVLTLFVAGCAVLAEPKWSKLEVNSDVEQFTDGSMYTSAQTQIPEYVKGEARDDSRYTDAIVSLKSPQAIKRILIRRNSEDTVPVDINLFAFMNDNWKLLKEIRGEEKSEIDIRLSTIETSKIKIKAQRATRTATGKSAVVQSGGEKKTGKRAGAGGAVEADRILREPLKFAEIEVYGIALAPVATKAEEPKKK